MKDMHISAHKRIIAGIMGVMVLIMLLFAAFYIASETGHECEGEDCPICDCIELCANVIRQISSAIVGALASAAFITVLILPVLFRAFIFFRGTPVSFKIRMNN